MSEGTCEEGKKLACECLNENASEICCSILCQVVTSKVGNPSAKSNTKGQHLNGRPFFVVNWLLTKKECSCL